MTNIFSKSNRIGLGGAAFGGCYSDIEEEECKKMLEYAFKNGVNYFDTSPWYGQGKSEALLGKYLPSYERENYIISTKVGRYLPKVSEMFDFSYQRVIKSIDESLTRLNLKSVDLLFAHDVEFSDSVNLITSQTLPALEALKKANKTKYIGISGYSLSYLRDVIENSPVKCDFVMTYARYTLFDDTLNKYFEFFKSRDIRIISGSPTGMGLLTPDGPPKWHPASMDLKNKCQQAVQQFKDNNIDVTKIALKHVINNKNIDMVLTGPKSTKELQEIISVYNQPIDANESSMISKVYQTHFSNGDSCGNHWEGIEVEKYKHKLQLEKSK